MNDDGADREDAVTDEEEGGQEEKEEEEGGGGEREGEEEGEGEGRVTLSDSAKSPPTASFSMYSDGDPEASIRRLVVEAPCECVSNSIHVFNARGA